jgi:hypothetical protein
MNLQRLRRPWAEVEVERATRAAAADRMLAYNAYVAASLAGRLPGADYEADWTGPWGPQMSLSITSSLTGLVALARAAGVTLSADAVGDAESLADAFAQTFDQDRGFFGADIYAGRDGDCELCMHGPAVGDLLRRLGVSEPAAPGGSLADLLGV